MFISIFFFFSCDSLHLAVQAFINKPFLSCILCGSYNSEYIRELQKIKALEKAIVNVDGVQGVKQIAESGR